MRAVKNILYKGGYFDRNIEGYEVREDQIKMAEKVESVLEEGGTLVCEGECGVGKTYAYLLPSIENSINKGEKCLIVTDGISLQEQLFLKDIPTVVKAISEELDIKRRVRYSYLKGRNNYLCKAKVEDFKLKLLHEESLNLKKTKLEKEILEWIDASATGDISDFTGGIPANLRNELCVMDNNCAAGCEYKLYKNCFYDKAKDKALMSDICVINYHLLFFDLKSDFNVLKGAFSTIVLDEAHQVEKVVQGIYDEQIKRDSIKILIEGFVNKTLSGDLSNFITKMTLNQDIYNKAYIEKLFNDLQKEYEMIFNSVSGESFDKSKVVIFDALKSNPDFSVAKDLIQTIYTELCCMHGILTEISDKLPGEEKEILRIVTQISRSTNKLMSAYKIFNTSNESDKQVLWVEKDTDITLNYKLFDYSNLIRCILGQYRSAVVTSATLTIDHSFDYIIGRLGLDKDKTETLIAKSPYNLSEQLLWYKFNNMPDIKSETYMDYLCSCIKLSIETVGGGALCLFTSIYKMNKVCDYLRNEIPNMNILKQGELPQSESISRFRSDKDSVLIGSRSLFTGVDVKGDSLRLLILDKLPFPQADDPVVYKMNMNQHWYKTFMEHSLPKMMIDLKQIVGRAVRSKTDKCVVLIFDPRFESAKYSGRIKSMFGDMLVTNNYMNFPLFLK